MIYVFNYFHTDQIEKYLKHQNHRKRQNELWEDMVHFPSVIQILSIHCSGCQSIAEKLQNMLKP